MKKINVVTTVKDDILEDLSGMDVRKAINFLRNFDTPSHHISYDWDQNTDTYQLGIFHTREETDDEARERIAKEKAEKTRQQAAWEQANAERKAKEARRAEWEKLNREFGYR